MNKSLLTFCLVLMISLSACSDSNFELYVSNQFNPSDSTKNKESFVSIHAALQKAQEIKADHPTSRVTINIAEGNYYLQSPLLIDARLNGLRITGAGADKVSMKGSIPLELSWERVDEHRYSTKVPEDIEFDQLIVNGQKQILARYPNYDEVAHYWQGYAADAISKERIASWKKPEGAFFHALHSGRWGGFHFRITGVDKDGSAILEGGQQNNRASKPHPEYRMVENVYEELDSPKEWFLDTEEHRLYYWPESHVDLRSAKVEVAVLKDLLQVLGSREEPVKDIAISGVKFEQTTRTFMEAYEPLLRSDWTIYRGSVIYFEGTENCVISDCEFSNLGGNVIMASRYNKGLVVRGNHIHDCGASAVSFVGDPSAVRSPSFNYGNYVALDEMDTLPGPKNDLYPRACLVEDNLIHRIGRIEKQSAGVEISMAMDITVRHNSIYDVPRAGINIGDGTWGGHILEFNDVFNTVLETSDHGSFNSWGRDRFWHPKRHVMDELTTANPSMPRWDAIHTTIIRNNRFRCDHGWDIDLDDGSSNYHIYNNLCLNSGLKLREGFYRVVENNILVNNSLHPHVWFANSEDVFRKNIVGDAYQDVGLLGWGKELDYNLFPTEEAMMKSQIYNRDLHSKFGDPLFKDPDNFDFAVKEQSPALALGFVNFPMDQFGVIRADLKNIAKTPEVPVLRDPSTIATKGSPVVAWLRNNLKSVDSEQEQSAYGLNTNDGVIVLSTWSGSPAVKNNGLKKRDVILEVDGVKIKNTLDFLKEVRKFQKAGSMPLVVMRNQEEQALTIHLK